ncbi:MAG: short-chain dehydrogenase [Acidobacteria bacterium]|nr:MAG: short-chain dehydrogenase [Acidobacteriota bacterium]
MPEGPDPTADLSGKICLITGATSGIGKMAAQAIARQGADLILVGRNERAADRLLRLLRQQSTRSKTQFIRTDLSQQTAVRRLASLVTENYDHLDILINNAGARFDAYRETEDGIELTFATNHLGHFLLTCLLIEHLARAQAARIVTVGSSSHFGAGSDDKWWLQRTNYDRRIAYAKSKLANIVFAYELGRRLDGTGITSNAADPGGVATNFARNNGLVSWLRRLAGSALSRDLASPRRGAEVLVHLAGSPGLAGVTGKYFYRNRTVESSAVSHDRTKALSLWNVSAELTGMKKHPLCTRDRFAV